MKVEYEIKYLLPHSSEWSSLNAKDDSDEEKRRVKETKNILNQHLLSSMQMQNLVVLSGSGTSLNGKDEPTMGPSMWELWELCTKDGDSYSSEAEAIFSEIDYAYEENPNIEAFLSICEAYLQIKKSVTVTKFINSCKSKILMRCDFEKTEENLDGHKTFVHRLSRRRTRDSRLKLFTTNYDTCFEEAASQSGIVVIDGFSFTKPRHYDPRFFDFDIVRRPSSTQKLESYLEGVFQLYKLHGSVNWERKDNAIFEKEATPEGVSMIFPARGKYQQSYLQPHLETIARYLAALREPNTCLVITGFGFNDDHLSEPILSAIKSNPHLKVIISDYNAESNITNSGDSSSSVWGKLSKLALQGDDVSFINASFKDFAKLIPDLSSLSPAERMAQAVKTVAGDF